MALENQASLKQLMREGISKPRTVRHLRKTVQINETEKEVVSTDLDTTERSGLRMYYKNLYCNPKVFL